MLEGKKALFAWGKVISEIKRTRRQFRQEQRKIKTLIKVETLWAIRKRQTHAMTGTSVGRFWRKVIKQPSSFTKKLGETGIKQQYLRHISWQELRNSFVKVRRRRKEGEGRRKRRKKGRRKRSWEGGRTTPFDALFERRNFVSSSALASSKTAGKRPSCEGGR